MISSMPTLLAEDLAFPEGPAFARDGTLYFVNVRGGTLSRLTPDGHLTREWHATGGAPNGLALHADGTLYVCDNALRAVLRLHPETRRQETVVDAWEGKPLRGPNDLAFDPDGHLYFTDPHGSSAENPTGRVYRLDANGTLSLVLDGLAYPNGLCLGADGHTLFLAETKRRQVHEVTLDARGRVLRRRVLAELDGGPDGMALDVEGRLYVALYGRGALAVIEPGGASWHHLPVDGPNPTNLAFHGAELHVTEAANGTLQCLRAVRPGLPLYSHAPRRVY